MTPSQSRQSSRPRIPTRPLACLLTLCTLALIVAGCQANHAGAKALAHQRDIQALTLGQPIPPTLWASLGAPTSAGRSTPEGIPFDISTYSTHAEGFLVTPHDYVTTIETRDGNLNGFATLHSKGGASLTDVNTPATKLLRLGQSTKADVLRLLGPPESRALVPTTLFVLPQNLRPRVAECWGYSSFAGSYYAWTHKTVTISFDSNGVVQDVTTLINGVPS